MRVIADLWLCWIFSNSGSEVGPILLDLPPILLRGEEDLRKTPTERLLVQAERTTDFLSREIAEMVYGSRRHQEEDVVVERLSGPSYRCVHPISPGGAVDQPGIVRVLVPEPPVGIEGGIKRFLEEAPRFGVVEEVQQTDYVPCRRVRRPGEAELGSLRIGIVEIGNLSQRRPGFREGVDGPSAGREERYVLEHV